MAVKNGGAIVAYIMHDNMCAFYHRNGHPQMILEHTIKAPSVKIPQLYRSKFFRRRFF
jgi:hypothetical protein